jgi:NAD(P)-dependent dehydrogenase (short-subunit alcohol dehydrogenase family)
MTMSSKDNFTFDSKSAVIMNVVITGASNGIGYYAVLRFAKEAGFQILALSRNEQKLDQLKKVTCDSPGIVHTCVCDIRAVDRKFLQDSCSAAGMQHVDVLINNAGVLVNKPFGELSVNDWSNIYDTNVIGLAGVISGLLPLMGRKHRSHIVNISSMGGIPATSKFPGLSAYSSSKAAVAVLSECLAVEFEEKNISVNALAIGAVQTEMLEAAFPGYAAPVTPEEFSEYLFWFSTQGNRFINGKVIPVGTAPV